jgi:hypothetical protein
MLFNNTLSLLLHDTSYAKHLLRGTSDCVRRDTRTNTPLERTLVEPCQGYDSMLLISDTSVSSNSNIKCDGLA